MFAADPFDVRGALAIFAIYNPINVEKVATGVKEEVDRFLRDGVTPEELARSKAGYVQQQQVARTDDMRLTALLAEDLYVGRTMQFQAKLERKIRDLTPDAVNVALRKYIDPRRLTVVTAGDFKKK
jgi:zinc protease